MTLRSRRLRKSLVVAHVIASVGWLGAVATVLGLAAAAWSSDEVDVVGTVYIASDLVGRYVLIPLAFATLGTGVLVSFVSVWGLLRHYWVVAKLVITVIATTVLVLYLGTLDAIASDAREWKGNAMGLRQVGVPSLMLHTSGALMLLVLATVLAVFKPRGLTRYGWRRSPERRG